MTNMKEEICQNCKTTTQMWMDLCIAGFFVWITEGIFCKYRRFRFEQIDGRNKRAK